MRIRLGLPWYLALGIACLAAARSSAQEGVILGESGYWRQCYVFGPSRISAKALESEGEKVLGKNVLDRIRQETLNRMQQQGLDPAREDWKNHARLKVYRELSAGKSAPADWSKPDFDDRTWPLGRHTFDGGLAPNSPQLLDRGITAALYRGRFVVRDLQQPGKLTFSMAYHGGVRIFINGTELTRQHLPEGELSADEPAQDYPLAAYQAPDAALWRRTLGPVEIPAKLLRNSVNVLAVEVHASRFHPVLLTNARQRNWCDPQRPWPHAHVVELSLQSDRPEGLEKPSRPAGVQLWVQDVHHRTDSSEFMPPGEAAGAARIVGARNGTYWAQLVLGTDKPLSGLKAAVAELAQANGTGKLPAGCMSVCFARPFPADEFTLSKLGDERGLGSSFPDKQRLAALERLPDPAKPCIFDHLSPAVPASVPANTSWPIWLNIRVPANAAAGVYRGKVNIQAEQLKPTDVPLEVEVLDWRLPDAKDFQTVVACEENPYGVAKQYGVPLWSAEHFKLMEPSFQQLARLGNRWLNVPILRRTEFGNREDSMVRWTGRKDGSFSFDFKTLDQCLDLAIKHWGRKPFVNMVVEHGTKSSATPLAPPEVMVLDEATGEASPLNVKVAPATEQMWLAFGQAVSKHMAARGMDGYWHWGFPADSGEDPELKKVLAKAVPEVKWAVCPHALLTNMSYTQDTGGHYGAFLVARYWGDWAVMRNEMGWKSKTLHLLSPRVDGTCLAMSTTSHPMAYRILSDQALARGRNGIARLAADGWAGCYFDGMGPRIWITGLPVLFMLWPGPAGAETSVRFEMLLEGIQEAEARIFLEQALDANRLPTNLAQQAKELLAKRLSDVSIFQPNIIVPELEKYSFGWQQRTRELYQMAAAAAAAVKAP